jgi:hypothetical protein
MEGKSAQLTNQLSPLAIVLGDDQAPLLQVEKRRAYPLS